MTLKRCQRVEMSNTELGDIKLGDVVTITITGPVKSIEMGADPALPEGVYRYPTANVEIEVTDETVKKTEKNMFSDLVKEEDMEDEDALARYNKRKMDGEGGEAGTAVPSDY